MVCHLREGRCSDTEDAGVQVTSGIPLVFSPSTVSAAKCVVGSIEIRTDFFVVQSVHARLEPHGIGASEVRPVVPLHQNTRKSVKVSGCVLAFGSKVEVEDI